MKASGNNTGKTLDPSVKWETVDAVGIEKIAFDYLHNNLYVKFRNNRNIYIYFNLEEEIYEKLRNQEHKTTFLNKEIKGNYEYEVWPEIIFMKK